MKLEEYVRLRENFFSSTFSQIETLDEVYTLKWRNQWSYRKGKIKYRTRVGDGMGLIT